MVRTRSSSISAGRVSTPSPTRASSARAQWRPRMGPTAPELPLIGRGAEPERFLANPGRGRHTPLAGPIGVGKTHLLRHVGQTLPTAIYVPHMQPIRLGLLALCEGLYARGELALPGGVAVPAMWPECSK